jgi:hypothetical protein
MIFIAMLLLGASLAAGQLALPATPAAAAVGESILRPNETLYPNQSLWSPNRRVVLTMQDDGNLVVYIGPERQVAWSSRTYTQNRGARLVMQGDGNLVMYGPNGVPFATGTNVAPVDPRGAFLEVQDDGNVVVYTPGRRPIWSSKSKGEQAITWFYSRMGWTGREGLCQTAVEEAFGYIYPHFNDPRDMWNQRPGDRRTPYTAAPRGTAVLYNTKSDHDHIAISLGNGQIVSTSVFGHIGVTNINFFIVPGYSVMGWMYAPWGAPW